MTSTTLGATVSKVESSEDSTYGGFDLFATPPTHTSVLKGEDESHLPVSGGSEERDIEFRVLGGKVYTDLANSFLELEVKVVKLDGTDLPGVDNVEVWVGDNFAHSLFEKVTLRIGESDVEYVDKYPLRAFIDNAISFGKSSKENELAVSSGWVEKDVGKDGPDHDNASQLKRKALVAASTTQSFFMRPRLSMLSQSRFLYPGIDFSLKLTRTRASFALLATNNNPADGARILITKAVYHVRRMIPNDSLFNAQAQNLLNGATVKYPIDRVRVQFQTLAAGSSNFNLRLEHGKQLPNRVIVGLVREEALGGDYRYNPCAFKPYGLQTISMQQDGPLGLKCNLAIFITSLQ